MTSPARTLRLLPSHADAPLAERRARGRALRKRLSRQDQGKWQPDMRRADSLEVLARSERGRLPALLPIKHGRMALSPFTLFRGAVPVMAADLARLAVTGLGCSSHDPLVLQVKEEFRSAWAPYVREDATHDGLRVATGQRRMQTWSDPLVGWTSIGGRPFLVRQLADHKARAEPDDLRGSALMEYALVSGELFAKAHARTGDAAAIAGYCGTGARFARALARFALAYADQTTADHERFLRAIRAGRIKVQRGV